MAKLSTTKQIAPRPEAWHRKKNSHMAHATDAHLPCCRRPARFDRDVDDEICTHMEMRHSQWGARTKHVAELNGCGGVARGGRAGTSSAIYPRFLRHPVPHYHAAYAKFVLPHMPSMPSHTVLSDMAQWYFRPDGCPRFALATMP